MTSHYLERIEKYDDELNSFISITAERALIQAQDSDKRYANNQAYGLDGIPLAHKDIFCTKDVLTTCGSKMLHNFVSPYSSTVYEKLDAQGLSLIHI